MLLKFLKTLFVKESYTTRLEQYLISKNVKSAAEVDYWIREFDRRNHYA